MITINLLQEFSDVYFENYNNRRVTSYKLYNADGFVFIHIIFEDSVTSSWVDFVFVRSENYYEWLNSRRDSKLESIGI